LRPTTTRMGSSSMSIANFSAFAGRVALKKAFWSLACEQPATISCICSMNSLSSKRSASSRTRCRTLSKKKNYQDCVSGKNERVYFIKFRFPSCKAATKRRGVLIIISVQSSFFFSQNNRGSLGRPYLLYPWPLSGTAHWP
jgi:hypothetical protein